MERIQFIGTGDGIEAHRFGCGHIEFRRRLPGYSSADELLRGDFANRDNAVATCDRFMTGLGLDPAPVEFAKCSDLA